MLSLRKYNLRYVFILPYEGMTKCINNVNAIYSFQIKVTPHMNKKKFLRLINSERSKESIAKKLVAGLQKNPSLANEKFEDNQTIFDVLSEKNKEVLPQLVKAFLNILLEKYETEEPSSDFAGHLSNFLTFLERVELKSLDNIKGIMRSKYMGLLRHILNGMQPTVTAQKEELQTQLNNIENAYFDRLHNGVFEKAESTAKFPEDLTSGENNQNFLEYLWNFSQDHMLSSDDDNVLKNRLIEMNRTILGLIQLFGETDIIKAMEVLHPHFDEAQLCVSSYLIWRVLYHTHNGTFDIDNFWGLPFEGSIVEGANHLIEKNSVFFENFNLIRETVNRKSDRSIDNSFDAIVNAGIEKKPAARWKEVKTVAQELSIVAKRYYQSLDREDFSGKEQKKLKSFKRFFNNNTNYFIWKILSQPEGKVLNALTFFIEVARELWENRAQDLHSIVLLNSVLQDNEITRLSQYIKKLPKKDREFLNTIKTMFSQDTNCKIQRALHKEFKGALPSLALLEQDFILAQERPDKTGEAEIIGPLLETLLNLKEQLDRSIYSNETDIRTFIRTYKKTPPGKLAGYSRRLQHSEMVLDLTTTDTTVNAKFIQLKYSLEDYYLPIIKYEGKKYPPSKKAFDIVKGWLEQNKQNAEENEESTAKWSAALKQLKAVDLLYSTQLKQKNTKPTKLSNSHSALFSRQQLRAVKSSGRLSTKKPLKKRGEELSPAKGGRLSTLFQEASKSIPHSPRSKSKKNNGYNTIK